METSRNTTKLTHHKETSHNTKETSRSTRKLTQHNGNKLQHKGNKSQDNKISATQQKQATRQ